MFLPGERLGTGTTGPEGPAATLRTWVRHLALAVLFADWPVPFDVRAKVFRFFRNMTALRANEEAVKIVPVKPKGKSFRPHCYPLA